MADYMENHAGIDPEEYACYTRCGDLEGRCCYCSSNLSCTKDEADKYRNYIAAEQKSDGLLLEVKNEEG